MIRVVIADDETRICKLIIKLIDWDKLGMLIVGTASNGIEALELIQKENPDIVITDIRMPGYDGLDMIERAKGINGDLEFIIISGYGQFEYAKKAIEYGVKDFLLKPINKEELHRALLRVGDYIKKKDGQMSLNDVNKIRNSFLNNLILFNSDNHREFSLEEINDNYHFKFQRGLFRIVSLKMDYNFRGSEDIKEIIGNTVDITLSRLQSLPYELEIIRDKCDLYVVINYDKKSQGQIEEGFNKILQDFNKNIYNAQITIAYGSEVQELKDIGASFKSSKELIEDRIIRGTGKIIKGQTITTDAIELEEIFYNFGKKFIKAVEILDRDKIKNVMMNFKRDINGINISGAELKKHILEIGNIYYITMKGNKINFENVPDKLRELENIIDHCNSIDGLFSELLNHINVSLTLVSEDKSHNNLRQISQAKKYIEENYMKNITLEDLGTHIGFNPSYFSSLFKKETGTSFIEYLSGIRIEKAKDLLRESDLRIQDICLMVGYNDVKYFTKSFFKHTGIKPNEYRKIFA